MDVGMGDALALLPDGRLVPICGFTWEYPTIIMSLYAAAPRGTVMFANRACFDQNMPMRLH